MQFSIKKIVIIVGILLAAAGGTGAWFWIKDKKVESPTPLAVQSVTALLESAEQSGGEIRDTLAVAGEGEPQEKSNQEETSVPVQASEASTASDLPEEKTTQKIKMETIEAPEEKQPEKSSDAEAAGAIKERTISWGFETPKAARKIEAVIIHSSYDALGKKPYDVEGLLEEYRQYGVAAHYLIDRQGRIFQLVTDSSIAYHAGKSSLPNGKTNVNEVSIGIELMNKEDDEFTSEQYSALNVLIKQLKADYSIKYILGHNQIAPERKSDPWNIDWSKVKK
jgi:hypothetical protein